MRHYHAFSVATLGLGLAVTVAVAQDTPTRAPYEKVAIHIDRQPLDQALTSLGKQTGLTVILQPSLSHGLTAPAINGAYTVDEALRKLLSPLGLRAEYLDDKTVAIRSAQGQIERAGL